MNATCDTCHNVYDKTFQIIMNGRTHTFDSFECAIHAMAPVCNHCACKIIGHGVEAENKIYCCAHCAKRSGVTDVKDRSGERAGYMDA
jgi:hypothetical protein